jgi:4-aminobutyrate aminotransferase
MRAIEFMKPDRSPDGEALSKVRDYCFDHGMLTLSCGVYGNGMRFATPLNVKAAEIDQGMEILNGALASL